MLLSLYHSLWFYAESEYLGANRYAPAYHQFTVRKRIRIPCGILIQDGDRSVTLQTIIAYLSGKSAFKLKNHVPMNKIELPLHPKTHK